MKPKVSLVTVSSSGWATTRKRWESNLPASAEFDFSFKHLEDYAPRVRRWSEADSRFLPLWYTLAGRAAVRAAVAEGCKVVVLATIHFAGRLDVPAGVNLLVYGDATPRQYGDLYEGRPLRGCAELLYSGVRQLARRGGAVFLCMSRCYADGLRRDYDVSQERIVALPLSVDVEYWSPVVHIFSNCESARSNRRARFQVQTAMENFTLSSVAAH